MTPTSFLAWLGEASLVFGAVVLLIALLRKPAHRRLGAGWTYALWLAPLAALAATLAPAGLIELKILSAPPAASAPLSIPAESLFPQEAYLASQTAAPTVAPAFAPQDYAFWAWVAGALISLVLYAFAQARFALTIAAAARQPDPLEAEALGAMAAGTGLDPARRVRFTDRLGGPTACGLFHPVVLLPEGFLDDYAPAEQRVMLLHEAEHLRARHLLHRFCARLIRSALWFHPLAWIGERLFIVDQELACDRGVMTRNSAIRPRIYAETLLKTAARIAVPAPHDALWGARLGAPLITIKQLKERTAMLERHVTAAGTRIAGAGAVVAVAVAALLVGLTGSIAATDEEPTANEIAQAAAAVAEARELLRQRQAELRELTGEGESFFGFDFVVPPVPDAPNAPVWENFDLEHGFNWEQFSELGDGFNRSWSFSFDADDFEDGELTDEARAEIEERIREALSRSEEGLTRALEAIERSNIDRERVAALQAQAAERAARAADRAREAAARMNELRVISPDGEDELVLVPSRGRRADREESREEMLARLEALEEMLGDLREDLRSAPASEAAPAPEPAPEPEPAPAPRR